MIAQASENTDPKLLPKDIFDFLSTMTLGQDEVLRQVSVAVYRHINGFKGGNILLIGNSGTGKTTIMNSIQKLYEKYESLERFRVMCIMNANMLVGEDHGELNLSGLFKNLEVAVNNTFGMFVQEGKLKEYMENATVCLDEVDKISGKISGKVNVSGITAQHGLLTLIEGENSIYETHRGHIDKKQVKLSLNTSKMFFVCGGAFEGLYDLIVKDKYGIQDEEVRRKQSNKDQRIVLKDELRLADLFTYGMAPQFVSRFKTIAILNDLAGKQLRDIMLKAGNSPLRDSQRYFKSMGIQLRITKNALDLIVNKALENIRIGARALTEVFAKVIGPYEFDPFGHDPALAEAKDPALTVSSEMVEESLAAAGNAPQEGSKTE